jgi:AcrR family transcriptional regulator
MPKVVDHDERRRHIAAAVSEIAATDGLGDVSFRTVAARAGVSVSLVQHYFGDKANLLKTTLEIQSDAMNEHIATKLAVLGPDPEPVSLLRAVAYAFLPLDDVSRRSMLVYHGFAAAAMTDATLRGAEMFTNGRGLIDFFATQLARVNDDVGSHPTTDPKVRATALVSLLLGLSMGTLLEQTTPADAIAVLDEHLALLTT